MPRIDVKAAVVRTGSIYPDPWRQATRGREKAALGDLAGLTQLGVNLTRLRPGASSSLRHWHEAEDELVYVLEGEITLIEDASATVLHAGDAAAFKAGVANGHHLVNRTTADALYLEIGARAVRECVHYSDVDLILRRDEHGPRFVRRSGEPYPNAG